MSAATPELLPAGARTGTARAVVAASLGNLLEWYDFTVYALFAPYIATSFFPGGDRAMNVVKAFLAFGVGFIVRPLGAVLLGIYADRAGRKSALTLAIAVMALGTLIIASAPGYASIGIAAPLLLVLGRLLQGFSAGGEIGGAAAFLVESAPPAQKGLIASWLQASMGMSNILGALVGVAVTNALSAQQLRDWGWRIPFIVGLLIAPVGLYLRQRLPETRDFQAERERRRRSAQTLRSPLLTLFRDHPRALATGMGFSILWAVAVYVLIVFAPVYVQQTFHFSAAQAFMASLIGNVFLVSACFASGALSDRIGRRAALTGSSCALFLAVLPLFLWLQAAPTPTVLILVQSAFCAMVGTFVGIAPAMLSELFPTGVRSTGIALVYNTAITLFGGFAPALLTWFGRRYGASVLAPAGYVTVAAALALLTMPFARERRLG